VIRYHRPVRGRFVRGLGSALLLLVVLSATACQKDRGLSWEARFAMPALATRAQLVELRIRRGPCTTMTGEIVYTAEVRPRTTPMVAEPPALEPGIYAFEARAYDDTCTWFARGCEERSLPVADGEHIVVTMAAATASPACMPSECIGGLCRRMDAGMPDSGPPCPSGMGDCNSDPADMCETSLRTTENCGGCGLLCNLPHATESCGEGTCVVVLCDAGWSDCDSDPTNGCETSLATVSACGSCGNACDLTNASSTCSAGTCGFGACRAGYASCDDDTSNGCETAIDSPAHCGGCSTACAGLAPLCTVGIGGTYTCVALCAAPTATNCSSSCVDLATNARNCGTCGNVCTGQHAEGGCAAGLCTVARCDPGWGNCDSDVATGCETPTTTVTDCGSCGSACNVAHGFGRCETGTCEVDECEPGWGDCNGSVGDGCETSVTSAADCGECGTSCSGSTPVCGLRSDGTRACLAACADPAATNCGGTCIDARYDEQNCGSCDNICALTNATSACIQSMCVVGSCDAGFGNCDGMAMNGCETNIRNNAMNCGSCGMVCSGGPNATPDCSGGTCGLECASGFGDCDDEAGNGCERQLNTVTDCGACGNACDPAHATAGCDTGSCRISACDTGWGDCDTSPGSGCETDLLSERTHCGSCGNRCSGGQCCNGVCMMGGSCP